MYVYIWFSTFVRVAILNHILHVNKMLITTDYIPLKGQDYQVTVNLK